MTLIHTCSTDAVELCKCVNWYKWINLNISSPYIVSLFAPTRETQQTHTCSTFSMVHPTAHAICLTMTACSLDQRPTRCPFTSSPSPSIPLCIQHHVLLINLSTWPIELMSFNSVKVIKNQQSAFASLAFRLKGDIQDLGFWSFTAIFFSLACIYPTKEKLFLSLNKYLPN